MKLKWAAVAVMCLLIALPVWADVIPIISQGTAVDALETNTVPVATVSGWNVPTGGATWVSYADTGAGGFAPPNGTTATFTQDFFLPYGINVGSLTVWADDTADVWLDGALKFAANTGAPNGTCQMGIIGCMTQYGGTVDLTGLSAGSHTLSVTVHQLAGYSFGALWEGSVTSSVPEPASIILLGGVFISLAAVLRRRRPA